MTDPPRNKTVVHCFERNFCMYECNLSLFPMIGRDLRNIDLVTLNCRFCGLYDACNAGGMISSTTGISVGAGAVVAGVGFIARSSLS